MLSRRRFAASALALPAALRALALHAETTPSRVFIGTGGKAIYSASWNPAKGELAAPELAVAADRPDFLALHPILPVLYSVNESDGDNGAISSFRLSAGSNALTLINQRETHGAGPCFVSVDVTGQIVFSANYSGGSLTAFQLGPAGELTQTIGVFRYSQPTHGPMADRQNAAHLHCATVSPGNDFVLSCDLGDDVILVFPIKPSPSSFVGQPLRFGARPGSGPRHLAFHPNGRWLYCIHELDCTIDLFDWSVEHGTPSMKLRDGSTISTLKPRTSIAGQTACEILVSDNGRFAYGSTRGVDEITVYRIDSPTGLLTEQQRVSCGGAVPRYMAFDPSRRWLLSCNQGSGTITVLEHDPATGRLSRTPRSFPADTPMCVKWA